MASPVQFILPTEMCKYFLYNMQYSFSRICWYIGFLVGFIEKWLNLPWSPLSTNLAYQLTVLSPTGYCIKKIKENSFSIIWW